MKAIPFLLALLLSCSAFAQQLVFEIGRTSAVFDYESSTGSTLENATPGADFSAAAGYRMKLGKHLFGTGTITYQRYKTFGSVDDLAIFYEYQLDYLGLNLSAEYEFYRKKGFTILGRLGAEPQFLLNGNRTINNSVEDIKGMEDFDAPFLFAKAGIGANYCADKNFAISLRYDYGFGFQTKSSNETLRFRTGVISLGLIVNLKYCDYCLESKSAK